jgi:N-acetylmuramoyl-L-alanine amidase
MIVALLREARFWPMLWRYRLAYQWRFADKGTLAFLVMLGLLMLGVAGIISLACLEATRIESARPQTVPRVITRAERRADDLQCLAENVYFEARGEPLAGQYAVAEVTLNRTRTQNFPHTVCGVVHEMRWDPNRGRPVADFSWTELGSLAPPDGAAWRQAMAVASAAYDELHAPLVPGALFYHAVSVRPAWAKTRRAVATIGNHIFYR